MVIGRSKRFTDVGYKIPGSACYIQCSSACTEYFNKQDDDEVVVDISGDTDNQNNNGNDQVNLRNSIITQSSENTEEYELMSKLLNCSLPDIKDRLQRDETARRARFGTLKDIPNFEFRLTKSENRIKSLLVKLIVIVNGYSPGGREATSVDPIFNEDISSTSQEVLDYICSFTGVKVSNSLFDNIKIFLEVLKIIAQANKNDISQMAQLLGISCVSQFFRQTRSEPDMEKKNKFLFEPKFWYYNNYYFI